MIEPQGKKNILLLGPPGAGKGTQAQFLAQEFDLARIDTGNIIRAAIKAETSLGIKAKEYVSAGKLVPDELVIGLILAELKAAKELGKSFLLDGFPRNLNQAEALEESLIANELELNYVLEIEVDPNKLLERIIDRRICTNKSCNAVYHLKFSPPKKENVCDICGSPLYHRDDDKPELVKARFETYLRETLPLIEFYGEKKKLIKINGNQSTAKVSADIMQVLCK